MTTPADGVSPFFSFDHRECDDAWAAFEEAVTKKDTARASQLWTAFEKRMRRHFAIEEEVLFPAFEDATGMHGGGPTAMMRHEHRQMRGVLDQMAQSASQGDLQSVLDQGDTLLMVIQQHNAKEEGILYPMADQALGAQWKSLAGRIDGYLSP